jgi:hypothetical protein
MALWWKFEVGIAAFAIMLAAIDGVDYAIRFRDFARLSKETLVREAHAYIRDRTDGHQMACLYVVQCDGEHARLEIVAEISSLDLQAVKDRIWRRRFSDYCSGRTANFALHLIPREGHEEQPDRVAHAFWTFRGNGFYPRFTRFWGGAFTDQPWERCTPGKAIAR